MASHVLSLLGQAVARLGEFLFPRLAIRRKFESSHHPDALAWAMQVGMEYWLRWILVILGSIYVSVRLGPPTGAFFFFFVVLLAALSLFDLARLRYRHRKNEKDSDS